MWPPFHPGRKADGNPCLMTPFLRCSLLLENKVQGQVQQRRGWIPFTRNPRPGLVPLVIICVIIPALGYQCSRTGVAEFKDGCSGGRKGAKRVTTWVRPPAAEDGSVNNGVGKLKPFFEHFEYFIEAKLFHFASVSELLHFAWTCSATHHAV